MFTGLVEAIGRIAEVEAANEGIRVQISTALSAELAPGDSLAVNGVCLTVTSINGAEVTADVGPETARVTTLGSLRRLQSVNLERPMRADSRFGGHFVQGHVDGTGVIEEIRRDADAHWITISLAPALAPYLVEKGSVAIDGISLTIAHLYDARFDVMIIPFTWEHTNLSGLRTGDRVNLESDVIGKYVVRAAQVAGMRQ